MENYVYLTVNGKEGYDNVKKWLDAPREAKELFVIPEEFVASLDVNSQIKMLIQSMQTQLPPDNTEWSQSVVVTDPYSEVGNKHGTITAVLCANGDICVIAQYLNPKHPSLPHTYLGYNGSVAGMMKFMTELNYTAQPADTVEGATVSNIVLNVDTADIEK